jgi:hypothetical protein
MVIVAYDERSFILRNSWSMKWPSKSESMGLSGHTRLPFSDFENYIKKFTVHKGFKEYYTMECWVATYNSFIPTETDGKIALQHPTDVTLVTDNGATMVLKWNKVEGAAGYVHWQSGPNVTSILSYSEASKDDTYTLKKHNKFTGEVKLRIHSMSATTKRLGPGKTFTFSALSQGAPDYFAAAMALAETEAKRGRLEPYDEPDPSSQAEQVRNGDITHVRVGKGGGSSPADAAPLRGGRRWTPSAKTST